ncbi:MAG: hypothetical protein HY521_03780 [Proteobacteria bacterium]|nr:hypothetical protein [Pseudomonadota bacterium]
MTTAHQVLFHRVFDDGDSLPPPASDGAQNLRKFVFQLSLAEADDLPPLTEAARLAFLEGRDGRADGAGSAPQVRPFIIETRFGGEEEEDEEPEPEPEPAPVEPEPEPEPTFGAEDLARARAEGVAEGREAGVRELRASLDQASAEALEQLAARLPALAEAQRESNERLQSQAIAVAAVVMRKIFPELTRRHGTAEIEAMIRDCLRDLLHEPRVIVRLGPELADSLRPRIEATAQAGGFVGQLSVVADEVMAPGDCRVEWGASGSERVSARLWEEIDRIVSGALGVSLSEVEGPAEEAGPPPPAKDAAGEAQDERRAEPGGNQ